MALAEQGWFDLYDVRLKTDPYPLYERLLREPPFLTIIDGVEAAVFSRYRHVEEIYADASLFSSVKPPMAVQKVDYFSGNQNVAFSDPPLHTRLRRALKPAFMPASVQRLAPRIEAAATDILAGLQGRDEIELMADVARPLSQRVMLTELLGIPAGDHHIFLDLAKALFTPGGRPPGSPAAIEFERCWAAALAYSQDMVAAEKAHASNEVLGSIVARSGPSGSLADDEVVSLLTTLMTGGFSTIGSLIGNVFVGLVGRPDQLALLRAEQGLLPNAIEEVARHRAPGLFNYRFPTRDTEVGGLPLKKAMPVYMLQGATSFDPEMFEDPFRFDIRRQPKRLLVFGHGIHHCIGAPVARLTARTLLRQALDLYPGIALAAPAAELVYSEATQELSPTAVPLHVRTRS